MSAEATSKSGKGRDLTVLAVSVLCCLLPFAGKPLHVDDPLFVWSAERIRQDPTDFFGRQVNWNGELKPLADITKNPPLACYLLAGWSLLVGWNEAGLHVAFSLQAVAAAWGTYYLARRFCQHPLWAASIAIATPAFVVSGTSLMCDMLMFAFWCWAIEFWWRGLDDGRTRNFVAGGLCVAAATLTKYFGLSLFPLLLYLTLVRPNAPRRPLVWLLLPLSVVGAFEAYGYAKYGQLLMLDAAYFASKAQYDKLYVPVLAKAYGSIVYAGGCFVTTLLFAPWIWSKRALAAFVAAALLLTVTLVAIGHLRDLSIRQGPDIDWNAAAHLAIFTIAGILLLAMVVADFWRQPRWEASILTLCFSGTWLFAAGVNWTINARSFLPAAPVIGILIVRQLEYAWRTGQRPAPAAWILTTMTAAALAVALSIAWGDYRTAETFRQAAEEVGSRYANPARPPWFQGHWGFQYYMERAGAKAVDYSTDRMKPGDRVIVPKFGNHLQWPDANKARLIDTTFTPYECPIVTLSNDLQAMFYAQAEFPFRIFNQQPAECLIYKYR